MLKKYRLKINDRKTRIIDLEVSNHVRITGINISKRDDNFRTLTVGRKMKNELYHKTLQLFVKDMKDENWLLEASKIRGLQSFILSVEDLGMNKHTQRK